MTRSTFEVIQTASGLSMWKGRHRSPRAALLAAHKAAGCDSIAEARSIAPDDGVVIVRTRDGATWPASDFS